MQTPARQKCSNALPPHEYKLHNQVCSTPSVKLISNLFSNYDPTPLEVSSDRLKILLRKVNSILVIEKQHTSEIIFKLYSSKPINPKTLRELKYLSIITSILSKIDKNTVRIHRHCHEGSNYLTWFLTTVASPFSLAISYFTVVALLVLTQCFIGPIDITYIPLLVIVTAFTMWFVMLLAMRFTLSKYVIENIVVSGTELPLKSIIYPIARKLGMGREVVVSVLPTGRVLAIVIPLPKPMLVLSHGLLSMLSIDELEAVLAHELSHVRGLDFVHVWLFAVAEYLLRLLVITHLFYRSPIEFLLTILIYLVAVIYVFAIFSRFLEIRADIRSLEVINPLALASALVKVCSHDVASVLSREVHSRKIPLLRSSLLSMHPHVLLRVKYLVKFYLEPRLRVSCFRRVLTIVLIALGLWR
ncbi:MAG: hypothetical protein DRJ40_01835 [Thermoprotei archaeon]|nr:MAG: hypothetical protein DRJ40_01835 [Thermoprotei archaeon]